jgi:hypothetical protein
MSVLANSIGTAVISSGEGTPQQLCYTDAGDGNGVVSGEGESGVEGSGLMGCRPRQPTLIWITTKSEPQTATR